MDALVAPIPALALAGLFAQQSARPRTLGTLPTDSISFGVLLIGVLDRRDGIELPACTGARSSIGALALQNLTE
jgi:NAD-dependent oxidoreductase involved in siderophore biosynthesis